MFRSLFIAGACAILASGTATAGTHQREEASRTVDRTIAVTPGQSLRIEHAHGDVRLTTHGRPELRIQASIRVSAPSQADAKEFVDRIEIEISETPAAVFVRTRYPDSSWWRNRRNLSYSVDYTVVMPERMPLHVRNNFGDVFLAGVKADATVVNAHGSVEAVDGGGRHTLENSFGPIEVQRINADVTITSANGNVTAATIGGGLNVTNRFGRVNVSSVKGASVVSNSNGQVDLADSGGATVTNSFGAVTIRSVTGPLIVSNSNGGVTATTVKGTAKVTSSFGPIDLRDLGADTTIENSNGAVKAVNVHGSTIIRTSFAPTEVASVTGSLTITNQNGAIAVRDVGGAADLRTSFGRVDAEGLKAGVRVTSGNAGVRIADARGPIAVTTSFGPVELRNVDGKVDVRNQNGAIDASFAPKSAQCHDISLATRFSPIQLQLPGGGYTVTAETSFGRIHSDVPITASGVIGEGRLSGAIGGGGCALQLTNANGDIRILKPGATP